MSEQEEQQTATPSPELLWLYPEAGDQSPPKGAALLLLTDGGTPTIGIWGPGYMAWAKFPTRNRSKEPRPYYRDYSNKK